MGDLHVDLARELTQTHPVLDEEIGEHVLERLVDAFAAGHYASFFVGGFAELLMPRRLNSQSWKTTTNPVQMAQEYKVSELAMSYRLVNLGLR